MEQFQTLSADAQLLAVLARAADLLETDPRQVEELTQAALKVAPGQPQALQLLVATRRAQGDVAGVCALLESMAADTPKLASVHYEQGLLFAETNDNQAAIRALSRAVEREPRHAHAWRALADALVAAGDTHGAANAYARHAASSMSDLDTLKQVSGLGPEQLQLAESVLHQYLSTSPTDLMAILLLGRMCAAAGRLKSAENIFARALEIDPAFRGARLDYAHVLHQQQKFAEEARQLEVLLLDASEPTITGDRMAQEFHAPDVAAVHASLEGVAQALETDIEAAVARASEVLDAYPGQPQALFLLIGALKVMGAGDGAREILTWMESEHPHITSISYELGMLFARSGMRGEAIERLVRVVEMEPEHPAAWRALGNQLALNGDPTGACRAFAHYARLALGEFKFLLDSLAAGGGEAAARTEAMLEQALAVNPTDVVVNRMKGQLFLRSGRLREAEATFKYALELAPDCRTTRDWYSMTLMQSMDWQGANAQLAILLKQDPGNRHIKTQMAANYIMLGEHEKGMLLFDEVRPESANDKLFWLNYGNAARTVGKNEATIIDAYRRCVALDPGCGMAWWGLANMKTYRFPAAEIVAMRDQLPRSDIPLGQRCHLEFALGRALEDELAYAESFEHYRDANALWRPQISYNADMTHAEAQQASAFFTVEFFSARRRSGCLSPDPIFIVGMPRAGSTLVEQILSSHSQVEGTMELPDLGNIVEELIREHIGRKPYPDLLADIDAAVLRQLGEKYLARTRCQRKLGRPFFTDKSGNNFLRTGLIHLILPNARIIDVRRHPLACGFSCYKQAFAPGSVPFAYDQTDIGRYYRDYAKLMAHFDRVLPGRVHRIIYEELVADPEQEIHRLLDYCNLPFEEHCLCFHETDRSVRTASSQQVRQPLRKKSVEDWQHYETWLQPMKGALGEVLTHYPDMPGG